MSTKVVEIKTLKVGKYIVLGGTCQYTLCSFCFYHNDLEYFLCIITYTWKNHAFAPFIADIFSRFSARF